VRRSDVKSACSKSSIGPTHNPMWPNKPITTMTPLATCLLPCEGLSTWWKRNRAGDQILGC